MADEQTPAFDPPSVDMPKMGGFMMGVQGTGMRIRGPKAQLDALEAINDRIDFDPPVAWSRTGNVLDMLVGDSPQIRVSGPYADVQSWTELFGEGESALRLSTIDDPAVAGIGQLA